MSIATEIARLQQAKADLKASINAKGGTITNETIDEYASKVSALPSPKEEETKTVTPNFSSGNVVVTPTSGKVLSQVTINKDANLLAENIKKDITVHGITGTLESGGDSARTIPEQTSGNKYLYLTVFGYDYYFQENPRIKITITKDDVDYEISPIANIPFSDSEYFLVFEIPYSSGVTLKEISQEQHHYTDSLGWYHDFYEGRIWVRSLSNDLVENTNFTIQSGTVYFSSPIPISVYSRLHMYLSEAWIMC